MFNLGALFHGAVSFVTDILDGFAKGAASSLTRELLKPLVEIPNPYASESAGTAWSGVFEISLVLLPICIAVALIAWPFSEDREGGLMELVVRLVTVLFFIGVSQPAWGFAIDATNAVTIAILDVTTHADVGYGFGDDALGKTATGATWIVKFLISIIAAILSVVGALLTLFFLLLRWYMVWLVYIGSPFFAVLWFAGRGPLESIASFAATFMRMGVYALLSGPVIALVLVAFSAIESGGLLQTGDGAVTLGMLLAELLLMLVFPVMIVVVVWKVISWAGQPLGVGEAASVATMAATAAIGGAVLGGAGGTGAMSGNTGGATRSRAGSVGGSSLGDVDTNGASRDGTGGFSANASVGRVSQALDKAKGAVDKTVGGLDERLETTDEARSAAIEERDIAHARGEFLNQAIGKEELDLGKAQSYDLLPEAPKENATATIQSGPDGTTATYTAESGAVQTVNLSEQMQQNRAEAERADAHATHLERSQTTLRRKRSVAKAGQIGASIGKKGISAGRKGTATGKTTTKVGAAAMVAGATGNSYLAYSIGSSIGEREELPMITPNDRRQPTGQSHLEHRVASEAAKARQSAEALRQEQEQTF